MLCGRVTRVVWFWAELALTGDAPLELRLQFLAGALFKGVGAADRERCECNRDQER